MADTPDYTRQPQPRMVEGAVSAHDLVVQDLAKMFEEGSPVLEAAVHGIMARKEYGLEKYKVILHAHNGRDYLADIDDEAGDLVCYLRALIERDPDFAMLHDLYRDYQSAMLIMAKFRALITDRQAEESQGV
jgi:hypothetical protein